MTRTAVSVVRINALDVPEGMAETLEERFAKRAGEVDKTPGFEAFELLRPTDGSNRYFVYTRWADQASFDAWVESRQFQQGHAQAGGGQAPAATGNELMSFDVVVRSEAD
jgi:heme-degrading monooxygenase HmoA